MLLKPRYLISAGIVTAFVGIGMLLPLWPAIQEAKISTRFSLQSGRRRGSAGGGGSVETYYASGQLEGKKQLEENETGSYNLYLKLTNVTRKSGANPIEESTSKKTILFDNGQPVSLEYYQQQLSWRDFKVELVGGKVDVVSTGFANVAEGGKWSWLVTPKGTGKFLLTVIAQPPLQLQDQEPTNLEVKTRFSDLLRILGGSFVAFIGGLSSLQGLVTSLRDQKKKAARKTKVRKQ